MTPHRPPGGVSRGAAGVYPGVLRGGLPPGSGVSRGCEGLLDGSEGIPDTVTDTVTEAPRPPTASPVPETIFEIIKIVLQRF